jgi:hypothetical protein
MLDQPESIAQPGTGLTSSSSPRNRAMLLSIVGLIAGVIALGLATIPAIAFERALPNPFADTKTNERVVEPPAEREGGVTLKFKKLSVNFGGKVPKKEQPVEAPPKVTTDPVRWFTMAAIGCALIGLVAATIGQIREHHTFLTVSSMSLCAAAITWQYFALGIAIGIAVAVFVIVLAIFGSALS